ncbi:MAG TPA: putative baseplate assembly protein, partial [Pyrinomonadaceae bacterium]|nr:putative baseplate assembly protein [Pyrinomonadaceae bacterium]
GATKATLLDNLERPLKLKKGDVLIFEERKGPETGIAEDADPSHRHAVMLTKVTPGSDPLTDVPVVEIEWSRADALPFALCVSGETPDGFTDDISVALGNVALADHGMTFTDEPSKPFNVADVVTSLVPDTVPEPDPALQTVVAPASDRCDPQEPPSPRVRYRPRLKQSPLTHAAPFKLASLSSAQAALALSTKDKSQLPLPSLQLLRFTGEPDAEVWTPVRDLLSSHANSREFVVEVETDETTFIRFGDDILGAQPRSGTKFLSVYRIGNGDAGNIGADALAHLVSSTISDASAVLAVRNPLPAAGGIAAETIEEVRQNAPSAFRVQERAVTTQDWEEIVIRKELADRCGIDVQRVAATPRWTGSWHTMFVTVDRLSDAATNEKFDDFEKRLRKCIERYRMAGEDLEIDEPQYVSLDIEIAVCIKPGYFFSDVKKDLLGVFSDRVLPNNQRGLFHPDNLSFGQPIYLSTLIAAAQAVTGVDSVMVKKFQRQHINSGDALTSGKLELGRLEIARLSNDPNFPERGSLTVTHG